MASEELLRIESSLGSLAITAEEMDGDRISNSAVRIALALQDLFTLKEMECPVLEQKRQAKRLLEEAERLYRYLSVQRKKELRLKEN